MTFILLIIRFGLSTIFISAGWSKMNKVDEHIAIVRNYRILPLSLVQFAAKMEIGIEILVGGMLLIGLFQSWDLYAASLLLVVYCLAVSINLLRGRQEISCGCGGLAGNHSLSWWIVIRNGLLIVFCLWLIQAQSLVGSLDGILIGKSWTDTFTMKIFDAAFLFWSATLIFLIISRFREIHQYMNQLIRK